MKVSKVLSLPFMGILSKSNSPVLGLSFLWKKMALRKKIIDGEIVNDDEEVAEDGEKGREEERESGGDI